MKNLALFAGGRLRLLVACVAVGVVVAELSSCSSERPTTASSSSIVESKNRESQERGLNQGNLVLANLVARLSEKTMLDQLQNWAIELLEQPVPTEGAETRAIGEIPAFVDRLDPSYGRPLVVVRKERSELSPSVMLSWGDASKNMWGLLLGSANLKPSAIWYAFTEVRPGVFLFQFKHSSPPERTDLYSP